VAAEEVLAMLVRRRRLGMPSSLLEPLIQVCNP
jgi:hypothetical protein